MPTDMGSSGGASGEPPRTWIERQREMYRLRTVEGLTLAAIGKRFGVGPERVRQLINRHIHHTTGQILWCAMGLRSCCGHTLSRTCAPRAVHGCAEPTNLTIRFH
jgi:DNA-binding CsgD family transcriptional regulator